MKRVFLLMGSNLGDRQANLKAASDLLAATAGQIKSASAVYRTAAWGITDQPEFYNQAVEIATALSPDELLQKCLGIEHDLGRKRLEKWGERLIDIDILFFGDLVVQEEHLHIPHPQIPFRRFTLVPLSEIAAELWHPQLNKTISQLLEECPDELPVSKINIEL
jgi:2-amino-4-hydroxy-6-hydroxymethyldihydropteridine diphosphokinase